MKEYISAHLPKLINSVGLLCDIIGAYLLWKFGIPERINRAGRSPIVGVQVNEKEKAKAKQYDLRSNIGFWLLIIGFALQLISNFV